MRVLLLEDDSEKANRINLVLSAVDAKVLTVTATNVADARARLDEGEYDLLVLDVRVPFRHGEAPSDVGGVQLLRELLEDDQYHRPKYVVGITGVESLFSETTKIFHDHGWSLIQYSPTDPAWANSLRCFVRHVLRIGGGAGEEPADAVVITALEEPEFQALRMVFPELEGPRPLDARTLVWEGTIKTSKGSIRLIAGTSWQMGLTACAIFSQKLLQTFRPSILAMTGICAGYRDTVNLGDVVVGTQSWEWQGGKIVTSADGKRELSPAPEPYRASQELLTKIKRLTDGTLGELAKRYFQQDIGKQWAIHAGPMVSGLSVVGAKATMEEVRSQHRKVAGLEMEAYAVYAVSHYSESPNGAIVMKGVCDFGDEEKGDDYQFVAAARSALLLRALLEST